MLRRFFQIISLQFAACLFLTSCAALAQGPSGGGEEIGDVVVRSLLWRLGGWVQPIASSSEALSSGANLSESASGAPPSSGRYERQVKASLPGEGESLYLAMSYSDALASWPVAFKATCKPSRAGGLLTVSDERPFLGANLKGIAPEDLASCLASISAALEDGVWIGDPEFEEVEPGLSLAVLEAAYGPRCGAREVVIIKADMGRFRLAPYHDGEQE